MKRLFYFLIMVLFTSTIICCTADYEIAECGISTKARSTRGANSERPNIDLVLPPDSATSELYQYYCDTTFCYSYQVDCDFNIRVSCSPNIFAKLTPTVNIALGDLHPDTIVDFCDLETKCIAHNEKVYWMITCRLKYENGKISEDYILIHDSTPLKIVSENSN